MKKCAPVVGGLINRPAIVLALSIAALSTAVKAQQGNSPSFKKDGAPIKSGFKDSIKDVQTDYSKLIQAIVTAGSDTDFPDGFAQAVGLTQAMPGKQAHSDISRQGDKEDSRECNIVYKTDSTAGKRPVCVLFSRVKNTKSEMSSKYYRVNLNGQLESAITLNVKLDANGQGVPEGRSRSEEDISSPDTQKAFKAEMAYWLKDWLRKQHKAKSDTAKLTVPIVKEHAEEAHQAVNQEATTLTPTAQ